MSKRFLFLLIGLLICSSSGCSDSGPQISGTVTLDGTPVENGWVTFIPLVRSGKNAAAQINEGQFHCPIQPGEYRVEIRSSVVVGTVPLYDRDGPTQEVSKESLPRRYNDTSELTVTVEKGRNLKDFELVGAK